MKRHFLLLFLLTACATVQPPARVAIPATAVAVEGARAWDQPISFGGWHTAIVREGATPEFLVAEVAATDTVHRMVLRGPGQTTNIECHEREGDPILVCGLWRKGYRTVLRLQRSGTGELRQVGGARYDVRRVPSGGETLGYEIVRDERPLAIVETVSQGRVWIDDDATNRDDLAATAAALLLFRGAH